MRNHIATWFKDNQWSFSRARRESFGTYERIADCLWFLNHQQRKFMAQGATLPTVASQFLDYKILNHKKSPQLLVSEVHAQFLSVSHCLEDVVLSRTGNDNAHWRRLNLFITELAASLNKYATYLRAHVITNQHFQDRVACTPTDAAGVFLVTPIASSKTVAGIRCRNSLKKFLWKSIECSVASLQLLTVLDLQPLLPDNALERRAVFDGLEDGALSEILPEDSRLCTYSIPFGNQIPTRRFVWLLPASVPKHSHTCHTQHNIDHFVPHESYRD